MILVDGDVLVYRASFSCEDKEEEDALDKVDDLVQWTLYTCILEYDVKDYQVYLTGKGNFRYDYAVSHEYKGNRKNVEKPKHLPAVRKHLVDNWEAIVSEGEEADDLIAIAATQHGPESIVASVDKDMLQIPCRHYNPTKKEFKVVEPFEGLKFFYSQILTGDRADNIVGLHRVGPVKANKILAECDDELSLYQACVEAYDGDEDRVIENARLLWLRRYEEQIWEKPSEI